MVLDSSQDEESITNIYSSEVDTMGFHNTTPTNLMQSNEQTSPSTVVEWGRRKRANSSTGLKAIGLMLSAPLFTVLVAINMENHHGDIRRLVDYETLTTFWCDIRRENLLQLHQIFAGYLVFQAILYNFLPGPSNTGQYTPGGHLLRYKTNGLSAFCVTYACFWLGHKSGLYHASFIAANFTSFVVVLNTWGLAFTIVVYLKGRLFPTSLEDRVFTGNLFYDICMGLELNPRLPIINDVKMFVVGRVGMMLWPLVLTSFAALQNDLTGNTSTAMLIGVGLQFEYILDFFCYEHWYLRTIDIAHDHVGFYIIWGCTAWLPTTYTLHAQYMARSKEQVNIFTAVMCFIIGTAGYLLFRLSNNQKYRVREASGRCEVWGKPATYITAKYSTADGAVRESLLLTCGKHDVPDVAGNDDTNLSQDGGVWLDTLITLEI